MGEDGPPRVDGAPGALEEAYAAQYARLYASHWWWRAREEVVVAEVERILGSGERSRAAILDVGCGDGLIFPRLAPLGDVEGVEPDRRLVTGQADGPIHVMPFESFDPGRSYDVILMLDVLEHLPDPAGALRRCHSLMATGGRLLLTVPAFEALWTAHDEMNHHFTRYRRATLRPLVEEAGLRLVGSRYFFHWLFPAKLLVRAGERMGRRNAGPPEVPPAPVNRLLRRLCRLEERLLGPLRFPFGSSLLAVCARGDASGTASSDPSSAAS